MFDRIAAQSVRHKYIIKSARSTWNFVRQQATLAQGSASEAHLNMDVNMRRLPELMKDAIEILSAPAGFMLVLVADRLCHYSFNGKTVSILTNQKNIVQYNS